jgi:NADH/F420H2 dehydrogenase subunit C
MDLAPRNGDSVSLVAFDRDHINQLLTNLAEVDKLVGQPVPKTRMGGGGVGIEVAPERLVEVARVLRDSLGFDMLTCVTGVDFVDHIQSVYHFRSLSSNWLLQARVRISAEQPEVDSLISLYPSANWLEREQYDMVGIIYKGHPDLRRILLDDDFQGFPLRRDFRASPITLHDRATTQVDAERAISGEQQRNQERIVPKHLGQGDEERIHPGKPTFGSAAVYLETGQGLLPGDMQGDVETEHGYEVDTDNPTPTRNS